VLQTRLCATGRDLLRGGYGADTFCSKCWHRAARWKRGREGSREGGGVNRVGGGVRSPARGLQDREANDHPARLAAAAPRSGGLELVDHDQGRVDVQFRCDVGDKVVLELGDFCGVGRFQVDVFVDGHGRRHARQGRGRRGPVSSGAVAGASCRAECALQRRLPRLRGGGWRGGAGNPARGLAHDVQTKRARRQT